MSKTSTSKLPAFEEKFYKIVAENYTVPVNGEFSLDVDSVKQMTVSDFEEFIDEEFDSVIYDLEVEFKFKQSPYDCCLDDTALVSSVVQSIFDMVE